VQKNRKNGGCVRFELMDGEKIIVENTWNTKISKVLGYALVDGYEKEKGVDDSFEYNNGKTVIDQKIEKYVEDCLVNMDEKEQSQIISYMKKAIFELCEKNNIPIDKELKERYIQDEGLKNSLKENTKTSPTPEINRTQEKTIDDKQHQL